VNFENRALKAISHWYKTLLELPQSENLLNEVGRILVEEAGYQMAWIGRIEKSKAKTIIPVAWAGLAADGGDPEQKARAVMSQSQKLVDRALSSGRPVTIRHILSNADFVELHAHALQGRYSSFIVLPLIHQNEPVGGLAIYAVEPEAFMDSEAEVLMRLAKSISQVFVLD
jgi:diguanylate cyclase